VLVDGVAYGSAPIELLPWRGRLRHGIGSDQGPPSAMPIRRRSASGRLLHIDFELDNDRNDLRKAAAGGGAQRGRRSVTLFRSPAADTVR
jgi:hypothetical protein